MFNNLWINKMWYNQPVEYSQQWRGMESWHLLQNGQVLKTWRWVKVGHRWSHIWFHVHEMSERGKPTETGSRLVVASEWEQGERWVADKKKSSNEKILKLIAGVTAPLHILKTLWIVHFKRINFMLYEYLKKGSIRKMPAISLSSFTLIKRLFSSSLLSAIKVESSAYVRLPIFLLAIVIPACGSSSLTFRMMYSTCKLNKQDDNIQSCVVLSQF